MLSIVRWLETGDAQSPTFLSDMRHEARSLLVGGWFLRCKMPIEIEYDGTIVAPNDDNGGNDDVAIVASEGESKINTR